MSGLSVEEQLAAGASVDDLVSAGVLYDDYDPDNDSAYDFTPLPTEEEIAKDRAISSKCDPMAEEEFQALIKKTFAFSDLAAELRKETARLRAEGMSVGSLERSAFTEEFKKKAAQLRAERLAENASDNSI